MNFDRFSKATALLDTIGSIVIGVLTVYAWLTVDKPIQYIYTPSENTNATDEEVTIIGNGSTSSVNCNNSLERREGLEGCVITWCLTILLVLSAWRIISSAILVLASQTKSLGLMQYWMGYKSLVLMISTFVMVPAFTATTILPSAVASFILDIATSFFMRLLVHEMEIISKGSSKKNGNKIVL